MCFEISGAWLWSVSHCCLFARCGAVFQAALIVKGWHFFCLFFWSITKMVSNNETKHWVKTTLLCVLLCGIQTAMAAGGLSSVESGAKEFFTSFYGIAAIIAAFSLLGCAIMGMAGMKSWGDLFPVMGWIVIAAGTSAIVKALWDWGKSISI
jgi:trbC/VIRB2 family